MCCCCVVLGRLPLTGRGKHLIAIVAGWCEQGVLLLLPLQLQRRRSQRRHIAIITHLIIQLLSTTKSLAELGMTVRRLVLSMSWSSSSASSSTPMSSMLLFARCSCSRLLEGDMRVGWLVVLATSKPRCALGCWVGVADFALFAVVVAAAAAAGVAVAAVAAGSRCRCRCCCCDWTL